MTDEETQGVCERVKEYLGGPQGPGFDFGNPDHFEGLVNYVRVGFITVSEDDLRAATAMCLLGPDFSGIPPTAMREDLLGLLRQLVPDGQTRLDRVMEFAIAYGCGKWRRTQKDYGTWEQQWEGAVRGLVRAMEPAVNESNRWLAAHVVGFPQKRNAWSDTWMLALRLKHPEHPLHLNSREELTITCTDDGTELEVFKRDHKKSVPPGAKAVLTVVAPVLRAPREETPIAVGGKIIVTARDTETRIEVTLNDQRQRVRLQLGETASIAGPVTVAIWECTCGTTHCMERHLLEAWDPAQVSLWAFVASAAKGPQPLIQTGSFAQGMYFPLLAQEGFEV